MTAAWLPAPRPALDDELQAQRAVAAAVTRHDRRELDAHAGALDAIAVLRGADVGTWGGAK